MQRNLNEVIHMNSLHQRSYDQMMPFGVTCLLNEVFPTKNQRWFYFGTTRILHVVEQVQQFDRTIAQQIKQSI